MDAELHGAMLSPRRGAGHPRPWVPAGRRDEAPVGDPLAVEVAHLVAWAPLRGRDRGPGAGPATPPHRTPARL